MTDGLFTWRAFDDRAAACSAVAEALEDALRAGLDAKGKASLMLSGGSTPGPAYTQLSRAAFDWSRVSIGLVDERWVPLSDPRSNELLVRKAMFDGAASAATLVSMKTFSETPFGETQMIADRYTPLLDIDAIVLGMGPDGHTASWFPDCLGLGRAVDPANPSPVAPIDATGAPVAGDTPLRMTLTASAIATSGMAILLIFGDEKRDVFERAASHGRDDLSLPVTAAILDLGERLTVFWAP